MLKHVIIIEHVSSIKEDPKALGYTETSDGVSHIKIKNGQSDQEFIDTYFHEMAHAFNHTHKTIKNRHEDERLARLVGNIIEPLYRKYKRGAK